MEVDVTVGDRKEKAVGCYCGTSCQPRLSSPAAKHHRPLAGIPITLLDNSTCVQLAQGCTRQRGSWQGQHTILLSGTQKEKADERKLI